MARGGSADDDGVIAVLDRLDQAALEPVARLLLRQPRARLLDWRRQLVAYHAYLPGRVVARVAGRAEVEGAVTPWALILKLSLLSPLSPSGVYDDARAAWPREALAYWSGLLDRLPGGLAAPRLIQARQDSAGVFWLWLEEIADHYERRWPLDHYGLAALHLGHLNGAYAVGRTLPRVPWFVPDWAERHAMIGNITDRLPELGRLASQATRAALPLPTRVQRHCETLADGD